MTNTLLDTAHENARLADAEVLRLQGELACVQGLLRAATARAAIARRAAELETELDQQTPIRPPLTREDAACINARAAREQRQRAEIAKAYGPMEQYSPSGKLLVDGHEIDVNA